MEDGAAAASFALEAPNNVFDPIWAYELSQQVILKSKMTIQATVEWTLFCKNDDIQIWSFWAHLCWYNRASCKIFLLWVKNWDTASLSKLGLSAK